MICEPGDIYLVRTKSILGKLIRFWTRGRYSHAGIVVSRGKNTVYGVEANWSGVALENLTKKYKDADIVFLKPAARLSREELYNLRTFLNKKMNSPYDWWGVTGFLTFKRWQNPVKWYCFELVYHAYAHIGRRLGRLDNDYIDGRLIYFSKELLLRGKE